MTVVFGGIPSTTGEPRLRLEIVLRLRPDAVAEGIADEDDGLEKIGQQIMRGISINGDVVEVLTLSQVLYRDMAPNPDADPSKMFRELMDRIAPRREPWERGQADGDGDPV